MKPLEQMLCLTVAALLLIAGVHAKDRVVRTGPDTYMIATKGVKGWSSGGEQKVKALEAANAYCGELGKTMEVVASSSENSRWARSATAEVEFRCVTPGH
jgi:hypothetical protein